MKKIKLTIPVITQTGKITELRAGKLKSLENVVSITSIFEHMEKEIDRLKKDPELTFHPYLKYVSKETMESILKEIRSKVKMYSKVNELQVNGMNACLMIIKTFSEDE